VTIDFITKLPKSIEPGTSRVCDITIVMVDKLTKGTKLIPMEETITANGLTHKIRRRLIAEHEPPDKIITNRDKLFTSK
jgi:hypothetical protein